MLPDFNDAELWYNVNGQKRTKRVLEQGFGQHPDHENNLIVHYIEIKSLKNNLLGDSLGLWLYGWGKKRPMNTSHYWHLMKGKKFMEHHQLQEFNQVWEKIELEAPCDINLETGEKDMPYTYREKVAQALFKRQIPIRKTMEIAKYQYVMIEADRNKI